MPLTTIDDPIAGECTARIAWCVPGHPRRITWRPGQVPEDSVGTGAAELGQVFPQAITVAIRPPGTTSGRLPACGQPGREAADP